MRFGLRADREARRGIEQQTRCRRVSSCCAPLGPDKADVNYSLTDRRQGVAPRFALKIDRLPGHGNASEPPAGVGSEGSLIVIGSPIEQCSIHRGIAHQRVRREQLAPMSSYFGSIPSWACLSDSVHFSGPKAMRGIGIECWANETRGPLSLNSFC